MTVAVGVLAMAASVCHLGRPAYAFRAVLGIRRSWLSREIVAFTTFALLATAHGGALLADAGGGPESVLGILAAMAGAAGVACSALVYAATRRAWWALPRTSAKFALSSVAMGAAAVMVTSLVSAAMTGGSVSARAALELVPGLAVVAVAATAAKLVGEAADLRHLRAGGSEELRRSVQLLVGPLSDATKWRFAAGVVAVLAAAAVVPVAGASTVLTVLGLTGLSLGSLVAGELVERWQFFTAAAPPRMPARPS